MLSSWNRSSCGPSIPALAVRRSFAVRARAVWIQPTWRIRSAFPTETNGRVNCQEMGTRALPARVDASFRSAVSSQYRGLITMTKRVP